MKGSVIGIYIAPQRTTAMLSVGQARAVPGRGLEGDRYFDGQGTFSDPFPSPDSEVTLIQEETLTSFNYEHSIAMGPENTRRNVVTRGIELNELVNREFTIGAVRFRGHGLCEPCDHLQKLTGERVLPGLVGKGGLRAQILNEGIIRVGDLILAE